MASTNLESLQDTYAQLGRRAIERAKMADLLATLDPQEGDTQLDDLGVMRRLHTVLETRMATHVPAAPLPTPLPHEGGPDVEL
jgi:hypothetical protein